MTGSASRWSQIYRVLVQLTSFLFVTSSIISNLIGLSTSESEPVTVDPIVWIKYGNSTNQTDECPPCTKAEDNDTPVGVIIVLSAIGGAIVGVLVTIFVMTYLRNRSLSPPPKDYDGRDDQVRFDVNRNDDVTLTNGQGDKDAEDPSAGKTHKKLERLVQRNNYQKPVDFDTEMAARPLIHNTDSSSDVTHGAEKGGPGSTPNTATVTVDEKPQQGKSNKVMPPATPPRNSAAGSTGHGEDSGYLNVGERSPLEQPYDSLAIVPEEVEYENHKQNVYEPILNDTPPSSSRA